MKSIWAFWNKRSDYEKTIIALFAAFVLFCLGCFSISLRNESKCDVCGQTLRVSKYYVLDVRTGEMLGLSDYVDRESTVMWLSPIGHEAQTVSIEDRLGCMRFPRQAPKTARYCRNHTTNLNTDFLLMSPVKTATVCYAISDGQNLDPDGRIITKRLNEDLDCWELEIQWDKTTPVLSS